MGTLKGHLGENYSDFLENSIIRLCNTARKIVNESLMHALI